MPEPYTFDSTVFLQPGEIVTTETPVSVKTVLGSCVAITMRSARAGFAAMAHCLLPSAGIHAPLPACEASRYVDSTIDLMLRVFARRGITQQDLEIKLFGGADRMSMGGYGVGRRNVETAVKTLAGYGIIAAASVTGGRRGLVVQFDTASGEVLVRRLPLTPHFDQPRGGRENS
jgi:chemotaxis protein CheD